MQHGSLSLRRPGSATMRSLTQSAFVDEDNGLVLPGGVFSNAGNRRFFQRRIASSFRSKARPTGSSSPAASTAARHGSRCVSHAALFFDQMPDALLVHRLVLYPRASGPCFSSSSMRFRSAAESFGFRLSRGKSVSPTGQTVSSLKNGFCKKKTLAMKCWDIRWRFLGWPF